MIKLNKDGTARAKPGPKPKAGPRICKKCKLVIGGKECAPCKSLADAAYRVVNREKIRTAKAEYYQANKAEHLRKSAEWTQRNPARSLAIKSEWRIKNHSKSRAATDAWKRANPDRVAASNAAWKAANADKLRAYKQSRRARERVGVDRLSPGIVTKLRRLQRGVLRVLRQAAGRAIPP